MATATTISSLMTKATRSNVLTTEEGQALLGHLSEHAAQKYRDAMKSTTECALDLHHIRELRLFTYGGYGGFTEFLNEWVQHNIKRGGGKAKSTIQAYLRAIRFFEALSIPEAPSAESLLEYEGGAGAFYPLVNGDDRMFEIDAKTGAIVSVTPKYANVVQGDDVQDAGRAWILEHVTQSDNGRSVRSAMAGARKQSPAKEDTIRFKAMMTQTRSGMRLCNITWTYGDRAGNDMAGMPAPVVRLLCQRLEIRVPEEYA